MLEKWKRNAYSFIWTQRLEELRKAQKRYPNSDRFEERQAELEELERKLADLSKE